MDAYLFDDAPKKPRRVPSPQELDLFAASDELPKVAAPREPEPWVFIGEAPDEYADVLWRLACIARDFAWRNKLNGVTVGETVYEYERSGRRVGGVVMEDKVQEQRQTSWLARVPKVAGLIATSDTRPSPLDRHHRKPQRVYVLPAFARRRESA